MSPHLYSSSSAVPTASASDFLCLHNTFLEIRCKHLVSGLHPQYFFNSYSNELPQLLSLFYLDSNNSHQDVCCNNVSVSIWKWNAYIHQLLKQEESQPTLLPRNTLSSMLSTFMLQLNSISIFTVWNRTRHILKHSRNSSCIIVGLNKSFEGVQDLSISIFLHLGTKTRITS